MIRFRIATPYVLVAAVLSACVGGYGVVTPAEPNDDYAILEAIVIDVRRELHDPPSSAGGASHPFVMVVNPEIAIDHRRGPSAADRHPEAWLAAILERHLADRVCSRGCVKEANEYGVRLGRPRIMRGDSASVFLVRSERFNVRGTRLCGRGANLGYIYTLKRQASGWQVTDRQFEYEGLVGLPAAERERECGSSIVSETLMQAEQPGT